MKEAIKNQFDEHIKTADSLYKLIETVAEASQICIESLKQGGAGAGLTDND